MSEKPLHVKVAEALGWPEWEYITDEGHDPRRPIFGWRDCHRKHEPSETCEHVWHCGEHVYFVAPNYDTDWSATGPLIERLRISVQTCDACGWFASTEPADPIATGDRRRGVTPLIAVCNLILALKEAGKL